MALNLTLSLYPQPCFQAFIFRSHLYQDGPAESRGGVFIHQENVQLSRQSLHDESHFTLMSAEKNLMLCALYTGRIAKRSIIGCQQEPPEHVVERRTLKKLLSHIGQPGPPTAGDCNKTVKTG
uniref:Uncharacterized protein n=1 Tax=Gasterosteus aculeatus aculeatus TaxID=481459 RepID=A0AAQ4QZU6_GASAC